MSDENSFVEKGRSIGGFLTLANARDLSIVALIVVVGTRFATADFNIDLKDFSFTDLVSLFLAVSSVALSALFYFKADESSRTFYTHTYKFTKEVSEMLGRIDSGFGEKLTNIGQGYNDLSQKFDRFSYRPRNGEDQVESSELKQAEIHEQEARRQDLIEGLMQRASLADEEKSELLMQLSTLSRELEKSKAELREQRHETDYDIDPGFRSYLADFVGRYFEPGLSDGDSSFYRDRFQSVLSDQVFSADAKRYMRDKNLLRGRMLTDKGVELIRSIIDDL